jgi:hypothetical protein
MRRSRNSTVLIPKTLKAAKNIGRSTKRRVRFLFKKAKKSAKNGVRTLDRTASRLIRRLTRRR